jgi:cyclic-di-GMP-binding protein
LAAPIALRIAVDRAAPAPDLEVRPRQVKTWLGSLPLDITFESGRKVSGHLAAVNRTQLEVDARIDILEAYRPAVTRILRDLEGKYAAAALPLGPGPRAALGLARELLTELATGYRLAAVDLGARRFATKKQIGALLLQATRWTAERMYAAYKSYTPVPTGTWAELHELYLKAEELGVAREAIDGDGKARIVDHYGDALLLSLTDPYRLAQGEATLVLMVLSVHRHLAVLGQSRPSTPPGGHFLVPCNSDRPPKPSIGKLDDTGGADWRLLDANPLVEQLRMTREAGTDLVMRLIRLWGDPPKRTARRDPGKASVAIAIGIDGVAHFVGLERRIDLVREDEMLRRGITMPLAPLPVDDASGPLPVFEWDIVNESRGGLRVRRFGRTEQPIAVGEVAGIKIAGKAHWAIGAVRWLTVFENGGMEFGLQYVSQLARAVEVKGWGVPPGSGLLLADEGRPAALLTSPGAFSHLKEIEIDDHGDSLLVVPSTVVMTTSRFEVFLVTAV